jgi:hypothetical protein
LGFRIQDYGSIRFSSLGIVVAIYNSSRDSGCEICGLGFGVWGRVVQGV